MTNDGKEKDNLGKSWDRFPLERLAASLWLDSADQAAALCRHHGLTVDEAAGVVVFRAGRADAAVAAADPPSTAPLAVPLSTHIEQQVLHLSSEFVFHFIRFLSSLSLLFHYLISFEF